MNFVDTCNKIFKETTNLYHNYDNIDAVVECCRLRLENLYV